MSKAHDPHWRYVALRLEGPRPVSRRALGNALLGRARRESVPDEHAPQLTRYAWPYAIVKVHHHALAAARAWLPRIDFAVDGDQKVPLLVRTVSSSGTIRTLTQRLGILEERAEGKPVPREASAKTRRLRPGPAPEGGRAHGGPGNARDGPPSSGPAPPVRAPGRRRPGS